MCCWWAQQDATRSHMWAETRRSTQSYIQAGTRCPFGQTGERNVLYCTTCCKTHPTPRAMHQQLEKFRKQPLIRPDSDSSCMRQFIRTKPRQQWREIALNRNYKAIENSRREIQARDKSQAVCKQKASLDHTRERHPSTDGACGLTRR